MDDAITCNVTPGNVIFAMKHVLLFYWSNIWTNYDWATWQVFGLNTPLGFIKMRLEDLNFKILLIYVVNLQWKAFWFAIQAFQPIRFLLFCFVFLAMTNLGRADWLTILNESDFYSACFYLLLQAVAQVWGHPKNIIILSQQILGEGGKMENISAAHSISTSASVVPQTNTLLQFILLHFASVISFNVANYPSTFGV